MADVETKNENDRTLRQLISQAGVLNVQQVVGVTLQLLKTVGNLHGEGKTHRAISADKVIVDPTMSARLGAVESVVTFGGVNTDQAACPLQLQNLFPIVLPDQIETANQVLINAGILLDPRQIDFYQLGALLCFMASGHEVSDYLHSCKVKADVPEVLRPIIDRALGLNSNDCFESSDDFAAELQACQAEFVLDLAANRTALS